MLVAAFIHTIAHIPPSACPQVNALRSERKGLVRALEAAEARLAEAAEQLDNAERERLELNQLLEESEAARAAAESQVEEQGVAVRQVRGGL